MTHEKQAFKTKNNKKKKRYEIQNNKLLRTRINITEYQKTVDKLQREKPSVYNFEIKIVLA